MDIGAVMTKTRIDVTAKEVKDYAETNRKRLRMELPSEHLVQYIARTRRVE